MNYNTIFPKNQEKSRSYKRRNKKNETSKVNSLSEPKAVMVCIKILSG
jgi:hypothetical protein